jgi:hypothetical protein
VDEDEVLAQLYGGSRDDFLPTRTELSREAKAAGDRELAKRITGLRKPTVAAWLVNQVVRRHPADAEALADVAERLGAAHRQGTGDELRAAGQDRRELLQRLDDRIRSLAKQEGVNVSADAAGQVDTTFQAALVDPDALREVLSGRLSAAVEFDPNDVDQWTTATRPKLELVRSPSKPPEPSEPSPEPDPEEVEAEQRVEEAEEARQRAERELASAQRKAERTDDALAEAREALDQAQEEHYAARDAVSAAKKSVTGAVQEVKAAESALTKLRRRR